MAKARAIPGLRGDMPYGEAAARIVAVRAQELWDNEADVLDTTDIERVHDMRVATRRLRAVLEIFAPAFPKKDHADVLGDVKALADALGARRDPDVHIEALRGFAGGLPSTARPGVEALVGSLLADQAAGNRSLGEALREAKRSQLRERVDALVARAGGGNGKR
jgi:CHAD domain-containing protein